MRKLLSIMGILLLLTLQVVVAQQGLISGSFVGAPTNPAWQGSPTNPNYQGSTTNPAWQGSPTNPNYQGSTTSPGLQGGTAHGAPSGGVLPPTGTTPATTATTATGGTVIPPINVVTQPPVTNIPLPTIGQLQITVASCTPSIFVGESATCVVEVQDQDNNAARNTVVSIVGEGFNSYGSQTTNANGFAVLTIPFTVAGEYDLYATAQKVSYTPAASFAGTVRVVGISIDNPSDDPSTLRSGDLQVPRFTLMNEYLLAGDVLGTITKVQANDLALDNVKAVITIPELGVRRTAGPFDLSYGDDEVRSVYLDIPHDARPGDYIVGIEVLGDDNNIQRKFYREITVYNEGQYNIWW